MLRNLTLGIIIVMLGSLFLMSCNAGRIPTGPLPPPGDTAPDAPRNLTAEAWSYPWPTRIHLRWDVNTEADLAGYHIYRYSIKHNISDYSALAHSLTPYVTDLINLIQNDTANENVWSWYGETDAVHYTWDDWGINPKYVYGYQIRAFDTWGNVSDPSESAFSATP